MNLYYKTFGTSSLGKWLNSPNSASSYWKFNLGIKNIFKSIAYPSYTILSLSTRITSALLKKKTFFHVWSVSVNTGLFCNIFAIFWIGYWLLPKNRQYRLNAWFYTTNFDGRCLYCSVSESIPTIFVFEYFYCSS